MLHKKCGGRVKQQYICPTDNDEIVERMDMMKGYEYAKGQYVTFSDEELKVLETERSNSIQRGPSETGENARCTYLRDL